MRHREEKRLIQYVQKPADMATISAHCFWILWSLEQLIYIIGEMLYEVSSPALIANYQSPGKCIVEDRDTMLIV